MANKTQCLSNIEHVEDLICINNIWRNKMFIYLTTNKINNKKYIGYCTRDDDSYMGSGKLIMAAFNKYGKDNFERIILEECNSIDELSLAEKRWIKQYDAVNSDEFYNLSEGGYGGNPVTVKRYWDSLTEEQRKERNSNCGKYDRNKSAKRGPMSVKARANIKKSWDSLTEEQRKERTSKWTYDKSGSNNPTAKKVIVEFNDILTEYECLKDVCNDYDIPYSSLKTITKNKNSYSKKYNLRIMYV
jgi:group I intron endonuclease